MSSTVSIILTSYNRPQWLKEAIDSVVSQTFQNWELYIMDDNSDGTEVFDIVQPYLQDTRISFYNSHILMEERSMTCRYANLINKALDWCGGNYITYLTDDDSFLPQRLERMVDFLDSHPEADVVCGWQFVYHDGQKFAGSIRNRPGGILKSPMSIIDHCSVMHRRQTAFDVGKWDDTPPAWGAGDANFWTRLVNAGHYFYCIEEVLDEHRFHPNSVQSKLNRGEELW